MKKKNLFSFIKQNKSNYSIYPSFFSENNNHKKNNIKIKLYNDILKEDYYILPLKFCNFRNCYVFDIPKTQFDNKSNKIIYFNFLSNNNKVITDPNYDTIYLSDTYVNKIDFKKFDKKDNLTKNYFKFYLNTNEDDDSDCYSDYKYNDSEKEENIDININCLNFNIINLNKSDNGKLDNECLLSNTFSTSTKDSFNINSPVLPKIKKKRNKSILKNKEGSRSTTKKRENRSSNKRVSFGSSQISFYKSEINK